AQTVEFSKAGSATPDLENLDQAIGRIMEDYQVPGGAFAMAKDGRLIHARGYGVACKENREAVQSDSLFRIASVSKPITAVAVLKLVEDGRLSLDDRAFQIVGHLQPLEGKEVDPRLRDITIRHLLEHSAGWDRDRSFDPLYSPATTRHLSDGRLPASCEAITRYMMGRRLDFPPGTEHAYSNLGYCVLGLIIEEVSGLPYETYVQTEVLAAMGIKRMRVGGSLLQERYEGEVCYYDYPWAGSSRSVFPNEPNLVPQPYGSMYLEATAANGGWIASAVDLVRFVLSVDGHPMPPDILHPETIHLMVSLPDLPDWRDSDYYYALGWEISSDDRGRIWSHDGAMPGTRSLLAVRSDGYAIALLFNSDPKSGGDFMGEVVEAIRQTVDGQTGWPTYDLFPQYYHSLQ
ncbi:MAG TPA: serine hydrolase domain-containing protein, partial [Anaerolineae bacterium]|nr:serine hydrolase domain-containing protein [Anaerolineae bacterium]